MSKLLVSKNSNSQTVKSGDICLCAEEQIQKIIPVKTNKPRITPRIPRPKPGPKPRGWLRSSQPKQAPGQRSVRQGIINCRGRRTSCDTGCGELWPSPHRWVESYSTHILIIKELVEGNLFSNVNLVYYFAGVSVTGGLYPIS